VNNPTLLADALQSGALVQSEVDAIRIYGSLAQRLETLETAVKDANRLTGAMTGALTAGANAPTPPSGEPPSKIGGFFRGVGIVMGIKKAIDAWRGGGTKRAVLELAAIEVWPIALGLNMYDTYWSNPEYYGYVPPMACAITQHHSQNVEETPPSTAAADASSMSVVKAMEIGELETKKQNGPLSMEDDLRLKSLQTHGSNPYVGRGPWGDPFAR
jgi:hypothetical protein